MAGYRAKFTFTFILSSHLRIGLSSVLFLSGLPVCTSPSYVPHVPPISFFFVWLPGIYQMRCMTTEHKAPRYVVFYTPLLPHFSWAQISSSAPYSRKPSDYVPPSMWHGQRFVTGNNQHNTQWSIYSFTSLHLHVSVSVDHFQGACSYRVHQLNMCLRPRYNDSQMC